MGRQENQAVKKYLIESTSKVLDGCPVFTKVFGENFAKNSLEKNLGHVYTNEEKVEYDAYCNYEDKSITICSGGEKSLSPEDIENDKRLKYEIDHEGAHIALAKSQEECEKNGIKAETGMCTILSDGTEIGVGLGEGLIAWILKKAGVDSRRN